MRRKGINLGNFDEKIYRNVQMSRLILFGIYSVLRQKEECTFERLVKECFTLFPKIFGMSRYSKWPDTLRFDRALRDLREQGLITGSPKISFSLTKFGEKLAKKTEDALRIGAKRKREHRRAGRGSDINWINYLKTSEVFQKFLRNKEEFSITEMEFRNLMRCTLESPDRILQQNFRYSKNLAKEFEEKDLVEFLETCSQKLKKLNLK